VKYLRNFHRISETLATRSLITLPSALNPCRPLPSPQALQSRWADCDWLTQKLLSSTLSVRHCLLACSASCSARCTVSPVAPAPFPAFSSPLALHTLRGLLCPSRVFCTVTPVPPLCSCLLLDTHLWRSEPPRLNCNVWYHYLPSISWSA
jgi:hypothetical protein